VEFQLATVVGVMGLLAVVGVYFVWVRKPAPKKEE